MTVDGATIENFNVGVQYDDGGDFIASEYGYARSDKGGYMLPGRSSACISPMAAASAI